MWGRQVLRRISFDRIRQCEELFSLAVLLGVIQALTCPGLALNSSFGS